MAAMTAVLPRVSKVVQEQVATRVPMRRIRRNMLGRGRRAQRPVGRIVALTAASLVVAGAATAGGFWLARRFAARAVEGFEGQEAGTATPIEEAIPDLAGDGTDETPIAADMMPLA